MCGRGGNNCVRGGNNCGGGGIIVCVRGNMFVVHEVGGGGGSVCGWGK